MSRDTSSKSPIVIGRSRSRPSKSDGSVPPFNPNGVDAKGRPFYYDKQGHPISAQQWAGLRSTENFDTYCLLSSDQIGNSWVSTVWLGVNHRLGSPGAPLIFETAVFGYPKAGKHQSVLYCTEDTAREGHRRAVRDLRSGVTPWFMRTDELLAKLNAYRA